MADKECNLDFVGLCKQCHLDAKISFIGGGNMAQALINGFILSKLVKPEQIVVCDRNASKRKAFQEQGIEICDSVSEVYKKHGSGIVFLTVKPHCLQEALAPFVKAPNGVPKVGLLISVLAGVTIKAIQNLIEPQKLSIVRVMPNTPALVGCGASVFSMADGGTLAHALLLQSLLETVGICYQVKESQINAVNGVSGSGPAYVYTFLDAMSDAGVKAGLPRQLATHLAAQTIYGAAKMQLETGKHPGELKNAVCSPGGTTIAGILALEEGGFRATVMHAVQASVNRADEIGKLHE